MKSLTNATAFVDWDTARRLAGEDFKRGRAQLAERSFSAFQEGLAETLTLVYPNTAFRVAVRLYHGWHRGKSKSEDRVEFEKQVQFPSRRIHRVSFQPEIAFSDVLLCGGNRCKLYDTLRRRPGDFDEQKMVDTALTCDLLHFSRTNRDSMAIVVGDDDDLLPGVFTAIAWGAKVIVARIRETDNVHLDTQNIIHRIKRHHV